MNFSLHNTTAPSSATLPPGAQDLPRLQRPARRRLSPGKVIGCRPGRAARRRRGRRLQRSRHEQADQGPASTAAKTDVITTVVRKGALPITVVEKGSLESSENKDAYCLVEGADDDHHDQARGDAGQEGRDRLPARLGGPPRSAGQPEDHDQERRGQLRERQADPRSRRDRRRSNTRKASSSRISPPSRARSSWPSPTCRAPKTGSTGPGGCSTRAMSRRRPEVSEELTLKKARFALEQAESKKKVLVDYTKGKTIKELKSEVEKARSDELAKKATWELEVSKEKKLERQIAACDIKAPADGLVVYANDPNRAFGSNQPQIEEGATVRERQKIFSLPDITRMQVNTKVHESQIDKLAAGT